MPLNDLHRHPLAGKRIKAVLDRCGDKCCYCGVPTLHHATIAEQKRQATKEHLTPNSRGGSNGDANIDIACAECNGTKGDMTEAEYRFLLEHRRLCPSYIAYLTKRLLNRIDRAKT